MKIFRLNMSKNRKKKNRSNTNVVRQNEINTYTLKRAVAGKHRIQEIVRMIL